MNNDSLMTLDEVLNSTRATYLGFARNKKNFYFTSVVTDSRNVVEGSFFIPLEGEFQDGHKYIHQAVEKGATAILVSRRSYKEHMNRYMQLVYENGQLVVFVVENTLTGLQELAAGYVKKFPNLIRVSITGSSGKTTTKEILRSLLSQKFNVVSNKGNLNSETGLPLSVFTIREQHEIALLEMGMNRENEIGELADCFRPEFALITNIGTAHIGKLGSRDKIAEEKKKIFNHIGKIGVAVIPKDDDYCDYLSKDISGKIVYYGNSVPNTGIEYVSDDGLKGTTFKINEIECHLSLPGTYNYKNALGAIAIARELSLTPADIREGFDAIKSAFGRSEIIEGKKYKIMQDCYNANPDSMQKALEFCSSFKHTSKKIFVLGDMLELGDESLESHKKIINLAKESDADVLIFVGSEMKKAGESIGEAESSRIMFFPEYDDSGIAAVIKKIEDIGENGDFILLKASRGLSLERIRNNLEKDSGF